MGSVDFSRDAGLADKPKSMSTAMSGDLIQEQLGACSDFDCWRFMMTTTMEFITVYIFESTVF